MKVETTIGTVVIVGVVSFIAGAGYGYHRTKEVFFTKVANVLAEEAVKREKGE